MRIRNSKQAASDSYLQCVIRFPLRAVKTEKQHDQAVAEIARLSVKGNLDEGELQYVEALAKLVGDFEDNAGHRVKVSTGDPIEVLKFLMAESKMSVSALGKI